MKSLITIITVIIITGFTNTALAAGDYIWEEKFKKAMPKAEQGDIEAQYDIGRMYEKGKGAVKDSKKAFEWYIKSANQGDEKSAYKVGRAYLSGSGVKKVIRRRLAGLGNQPTKNIHVQNTIWALCMIMEEA